METSAGRSIGEKRFQSYVAEPSALGPLVASATVEWMVNDRSSPVTSKTLRIIGSEHTSSKVLCRTA